MITPQELRIGNWVRHKDVWSYRCKRDWDEFKEFDFQIVMGDFYADGECTFDFSDIEPIPLTEEWMLKFGFGYLQNACWELGSMRIYNLSDEEKSRFRITLSGHELVIVNYVHSLQNFYHAITGKELTIQQ